MLKDCIEIFEKEIEKYKKRNPNGDEISFITDDYSLTTGMYYLLNLESGEVLEQLDVDKNTDKTTDLYRKFAKFEYLSRYMNSNKAVDKNIFSNNIYSFIVKKENIADKITESLIDGYYNQILNFSKDSKKKELYADYETKYGKTDVNAADKAKSAVKKFLKENDFIDKKGRLAIFFDVDFSEYKKEGNRYIFANVYNNIDYNYLKKDETFGLPDNNMGLNNDKPYLENKSRRKSLPYTVSQKDVLIQKLFFDDLSNKVRKKSKNLIKEDNITQGEKTHYYIHLTTDNGEPIIDDYSIICNNEKIKVPQNNYLNNDDNYNYLVKNKKELFDEIDEFLYDDKLKENIYNTDIDIKNCPRLTQNLKLSNKAWGDWFYKNNHCSIKAILNKVFISRILDTLVEPPKDASNFYQISSKASIRFNMFYSIKKYFLGKESEEMPEEFTLIYNKIKEKISSDETQSFDDDKEAFFAMGQVAYYLLSKAKKPTHNDAIPFLNSFYSKNAKNEILKLFKFRSYDITLKWKNFNNLYAMVQEYDYPKKKIRKVY